MRNRIEGLQENIAERFDGYLVTSEINMLYFSGFLGAAAMLIPRGDKAVLYIRNVNYEAAKTMARNCSVNLVEQGEDPFEKVAEQVREQKLRKLGFDTMPYQTHQQLSRILKKAVKLEPGSEFVWRLRRVKDNDEVENIRKAAELTLEGMQTACEIIKPGLREPEICTEIEYTMRKHGSHGVAFDTIVASGPHSVYPHGGSVGRKLQNGEFVIVDIGAKYNNYRADMSRTFVAGRATQKQERLYSIVEKAQAAAFNELADGIKASKIDAVARNVIRKAGYERSFVHGLGHGVGLEIHEQPVLNPSSKDVLRARNVVTDEPGVYIASLGGVRIEDTVLVNKTSAERLTQGFRFLKQ
ncbi:MAG: Xaa-Pro peptidase family protein [Candidatus Bathyarchaeota archaeon]|nr:Xaa-Pro peptidase family protein [Candidatus Bathyarchaeota archaeon]